MSTSTSQPTDDTTRPRRKPPLQLQTTTLWDYPSQHYGRGMQGDKNYRGATPSYVIWNFIQRFTQPGDRVLDPMCGSGTTLDVCRDTGREGLGFDLAPSRPDIEAADARCLPLETGSVHGIFIDPPYADHLRYSGAPACLGELSGRDGSYLEAMAEVTEECARVLQPGGHLGLYISDSARKGKPFVPLGFQVFGLLSESFDPLDIIAVTRRNRTLQMGNYHRAADEGGFFLRGFNYLFIMRAPLEQPSRRTSRRRTRRNRRRQRL